MVVVVAGGGRPRSVSLGGTRGGTLVSHIASMQNWKNLMMESSLLSGVEVRRKAFLLDKHARSLSHRFMVFLPEECQRIVDELDKPEIEFTKFRHSSFPTTDLPVKSLPLDIQQLIHCRVLKHLDEIISPRLGFEREDLRPMYLAQIRDSGPFFNYNLSLSTVTYFVSTTMLQPEAKGVCRPTPMVASSPLMFS